MLTEVEPVVEAEPVDELELWAKATAARERKKRDWKLTRILGIKFERWATNACRQSNWGVIYPQRNSLLNVIFILKVFLILLTWVNAINNN